MVRSTPKPRSKRSSTPARKPRRRTWDGMAPCGKHGADFQGQACTVCKPAPGPGLQAAAAAGAAFVWTPNVNGTGETLAPRGIARDAITAGTISPGTWSIIGGARTDVKARREVEAAITAIEVLRRRAARHGQGADAPKLDVIDRARAMFEPGQVPLGGAVGDLVLDLIGEVERLRGTSTPPPVVRERDRIRFGDLRAADRTALVAAARAPGGLAHGTTRLIALKLIAIEPGLGRYGLTDRGRRVLVDAFTLDAVRPDMSMPEVDVLARQLGDGPLATDLLSGLAAEAARHATALAQLNARYRRP